MSRIINEQYERAKSILREHKEGHSKLAETLLTKEVMYAEDLVNIFGKRPWKSRTEEIMRLQAERDAKRAESNPGSDATSDGQQDSDGAPVDVEAKDVTDETPTPPPYKKQEEGD